MTEEYPSLSSHKSKPWAEWVNRVEKLESKNGGTKSEDCGNVRLLPREDISLYGVYPKMEPRVFVICKECSKLTLSNGILCHASYYHSNNKPDKPATTEVPGSSAIVKKKSQSKSNKKRSILSKGLPPPPLFPKNSDPPPSPAAVSVELSPPLLQPVQTETAPSTESATSPTPAQQQTSSSSSRRKKSKKQSSKGMKEHESDSKHHSTEKSERHREKDPVKNMKSSDLDNNNQCDSEIRWAGSGSVNKHVTVAKNHQPIADVKLATESAQSSKTVASKTTDDSLESEVAPVVPTTSITVTISKACLTKLTTAVAASPSNTSSKTSILPLLTVSIAGAKNSQPKEATVATSPIVLMPMTPVTVDCPLKLIQLEVPVLHSSIVTIPDQTNGIKLYDTHPKPLMMPTMATRKIGGAFMLQNQHLERQRNAISESLSSIDAIHKPNILKCRSIRMNNIKRPASDRLGTTQCKQTRLTPDINGFILHANMSESAEAPQPNNSMHEEITLFNMK